MIVPATTIRLPVHDCVLISWILATAQLMNCRLKCEEPLHPSPHE
jgi:hypothetical protein